MSDEPNRKAFSKRVREAVYAKCGGHCAYCGTKIEMHQMQIDHALAMMFAEAEAAQGRDINAIDNLLPSCRSCNNYKSTLSIEGFRQAIERWPGVLQRDSVTYRNAVRFGQVTPTPKPVVFYFERMERSGTNEHS